MKTNNLSYPNWANLPPEILNHIFSFLNDPKDRSKARLACKNWSKSLFKKNPKGTEEVIYSQWREGRTQEIIEIEKTQEENANAIKNRILKIYLWGNIVVAFVGALYLFISRPHTTIAGYLIGIPLMTGIFSLPGAICVGVPVSLLCGAKRDPISLFFKRTAKTLIQALPKLPSNCNLGQRNLDDTDERRPLLEAPRNVNP